MRVIVHTVPDSPWLDYLSSRLPNLEIVKDTGQNAFQTHLAALDLQGMDPAIHIEDDVILTKDFTAKALAAIELHPNSIIQFFSMRSQDKTLGSRWDRNYGMNQCKYVPAKFAPSMTRFARLIWSRDPKRVNDHQVHRVAPGQMPKPMCGNDLMIRDWLRMRREPYWLHVPSLVQHRAAKSRIGSRSSKRQSPTFIDPDL